MNPKYAGSSTITQTQADEIPTTDDAVSWLEANGAHSVQAKDATKLSAYGDRVVWFKSPMAVAEALSEYGFIVFRLVPRVGFWAGFRRTDLTIEG
jgi:hypothetical protein